MNTPRPTLSQRIKAETAHQHDRMEGLMAQAQVFASRENYARFTAAQYLFQQDVEWFFNDAALREAVPDLYVRPPAGRPRRPDRPRCRRAR